MGNYLFSKAISINGLIFNNWCEFATASVHLLQKEFSGTDTQNNLVEARLVQ